MINLYEEFKKLTEDAVMGAGDAGSTGGGEVVSGGTSDAGDVVSKVADTGIKTDDVLGHCDHKKDGYMGAACFHIPSRIKCPLHRWEIATGSKKKRKKTPYEKGMVILTDSDKEEVVADAKKKAPNTVKKIAKLVKNKKQVQKTVDAYDKESKNLDKRAKESSIFASVRGGINDSVALLKDVCSGKYTCQWSTIAILAAAIFYVICPIDLIPDPIPVLGQLDDAAVIMWTMNAIGDELDHYRDWAKHEHKASK